MALISADSGANLVSIS